MKVRITEYLDIDLTGELWTCNRCENALISAHDSYKRGCRVRVRDPREIHDPGNSEFSLNLAPDPEWCQLIEYYCPGCFVLLETEYLPPGYPPTHDIELDIEALKARAKRQQADA